MKLSRAYCAVTQNKDLEFLYRFKKFPLFMGVENKSIRYDKFYNMDWYISKSSGVIQLKNLIKFDELYKKSHTAGEIGNTWNKHHLNFAKFVGNQKDSSILEIGGAHGILSKNYFKIHPKFSKWEIVEINPCPAKGVKTKYIKKAFDHKFKSKNKYNTIIHSHVLEHVYNPNEFLELISKQLEVGENHIFSIPNIEEMIKKKYTNALNFEHTYLLSHKTLDYLLNINGFSIVKKKFFKKDHSIFYLTKKISHKKVKKLDEYKKNKKLFFSYTNYLEKDVLKLNKKITNKKNVFLFGAHIFSQYLLNLGLKTQNIHCILDNDKSKQNKRLYGTNLIVKSPKVLGNFKSPLVILRAGVYNKEISQQILKEINSNTIFL